MHPVEANVPRAESVRDLPATTDIRTAGSYFGISEPLVYRLAKTGELPFQVIRLGGKWRVTRHALAEALGVTLDTAPSSSGAAAAD